MQKYIAFLRGINISGRNKIAMSELKFMFEDVGFTGVKTHLNSGNVVFFSKINNVSEITNSIEAAIRNNFNFNIPIFVIKKEELADILHNAPEWWGTNDKEIYDNLIFMLSPLTFTDLLNEIGNPKEEFERINSYKNAVFWSFSRKDYQKTNWWSKTATASVSNRLTIRTANTVKGLIGM